MYRKQRNPSAHYRMPPPYQTVTGDYARMSWPEGIVVGKVGASGISGRTGRTAGSGPVASLYMRRGTRTLTENQQETCYNPCTEPVKGDSYILMDRDEYGRFWVIPCMEDICQVQTGTWYP